MPAAKEEKTVLVALSRSGFLLNRKLLPRWNAARIVHEQIPDEEFVGAAIEYYLADFDEKKVSAMAPLKPREQRLEEKSLDEIIRKRVADGVPCEVIAKNLGIGATTVRRRMHAMGIPMPRRSYVFGE